MSRKSIILSIASGILLSLVALAINFTSPMIFRSIIERQMLLREGSKSWKVWTFQDGVQSQVNIYLFNIINPDEVANGQQAELKQIGPFVFDLKRERQIINASADEIMYLNKESYVFNENKTNCSLASVINTVDLALLNDLAELQSPKYQPLPVPPCTLDQYYPTALVRTNASEMLFRWPYVHRRRNRPNVRIPSLDFNPIFPDLHNASGDIEPFIVSTGDKNIDHIANIKHSCNNDR